MKEGTTTLYQQSNKAHKGQSKKIEKRRNQQKQREKDKKTKKLKVKRSKQKPGERLDKYIGKLLRTVKGETAEIIGMFNMMDEGAEISIKEIENEVLKKILKKIFKLFGLTKNADKEYSRPPGYESLKNKFDNLVKRALKREKKDSESSDSDSDKDSAHEDDDDPELEDDEEEPQEERHKAPKKRKEESKSAPHENAALGKREQPSNSALGNQDLTSAAAAAGKPQLSVQKQVYGPAKPKQDESMEDQPGQAFNVADSNFFDSLLQGKAFQSDHRSKLRQGVVGTKPVEKVKDQGTEEEQQRKLKQYFEDYDRVNRPKTLLELHQEKSKPQHKQREAFDRESLGGYSKVDSKSVFQIVSNASANLSSKFGNGKFKGTFM